MKCPECDRQFPHTHGFVMTPDGVFAAAVISSGQLGCRGEVRDSETGEVLFPAVKGKLRVIEGGKR